MVSPPRRGAVIITIMNPDQRLVTRADIDAAHARIRDTVVGTPLVDVSEKAGRSLWLKCENLQITGSFKIRGALNLLSTLPPSDRSRGVITYSSGNHGQALAYAARSLGIPVVVVMPTTAPAVKVEGARRYGAEVLTEGTTSAQRRARAERVAAQRDLTIVPPFDHPDIIAGQGTVGREILEALPGVSRVYVPVGGGGLVSGVSAAIAGSGSSAIVIGVEPVGAASMLRSVEAGRPVALDEVHSVADGLLPVRPGDLTLAHVQAGVARVVTVDDRAILRALSWLVEEAKLVVEPSGAAALAACLGEAPPLDEACVAVVSGGNIALDVLAGLVSRG